MSYDVFGDNDNPAAEGFLEMGWWTDEQVNAVVDAIKALVGEPVYEDRDMAQGISVRFLQRLVLLQEAAGLPVPEELVREAHACLDAADPLRVSQREAE